MDANAALHGPVARYWRDEERRYLAESRLVPTRFERMERALQTSLETQGDKLVDRIKDTFHNGMGIKWGDDQIKVFMAFLTCCLPLIYRDTWAREKLRVMRDFGMRKEIPYALVNMARRNGKTFVTSGTAAALLMCVPGIKIAIFSTCRRTSQMMMTEILDKIELMFEKGTHANRQDFVVVTRNMESVCFEGPDRTKRIVGSFPGSVRVSPFFFFWRRGGGAEGRRGKKVRNVCS